MYKGKVHDLIGLLELFSKIIVNDIFFSNQCLIKNLLDLTVLILNCFPLFCFSFVIKDTASGQKSIAPILDLLTKLKMGDKVLTAIILPSLADNVHYKSFKVTPRWQVSCKICSRVLNPKVFGLSLPHELIIRNTNISLYPWLCWLRISFLLILLLYLLLFLHKLTLSIQPICLVIILNQYNVTLLDWYFKMCTLKKNVSFIFTEIPIMEIWSHFLLL